MTLKEKILKAQYNFQVKHGNQPNTILISEYNFKKLIKELKQKYPVMSYPSRGSLFGMNCIISESHDLVLAYILVIDEIDNENESTIFETFSGMKIKNQDNQNYLGFGKVEQDD